MQMWCASTYTAQDAVDVPCNPRGRRPRAAPLRAHPPPPPPPAAAPLRCCLVALPRSPPFPRPKGSLGLFGNSLFQLAYAALLAERHGLALAVPERWRWRRFLQTSAWRALPDESAWALPVVADRVVLSHAGFKEWIRSSSEQYATLAASLGVEALSGRQLRARWPQVAAADLAGGNGDGNGGGAAGGSGSGSGAVLLSRAELAGCGLWGWFQLPTANFAPFKARVRALFALADAPRLGAALGAALRRARGRGGGAAGGGGRRGRLVVVHVRRGDMLDYVDEAALLPPPPAPAAANCCLEPPEQPQQQQPQQQKRQRRRSPPALRTRPPFEEGQGGAWDGQGCDWRAPDAWLAGALAGLAIDGAAGDAVWVCSDDAALAREPGRIWRLGCDGGGGDGTGACAPAAPALSWTTALEELRRQRDGREQDGGGCDDDGSITTAALSFFSGGAEAPAAGAAADAAVIADWFAMTRADVLLCSNSTLSFTAAMANDMPGAAFLRPDPRARGYVPFDPWDALPLLPARAALPRNHAVHRCGSR